MSLSHLLKGGWDGWFAGINEFLGHVSAEAKRLDGWRWPASFISPLWLEVLFCRALAHANDGVQKFVLWRLMASDQSASWLSDSFLLDEVLPRLSQSFDMLCPQGDVHQTSGRISDFFVAFVRGCPAGPGSGARRLLEALLSLRVKHHTLSRLVLAALREAGVPGALTAVEAFEVVERFFVSTLQGFPVSTRPGLATLLVRVVARLASIPSASLLQDEAVERAAASMAAVPDALLDEVRFWYIMLCYIIQYDRLCYNMLCYSVLYVIA